MLFQASSASIVFTCSRSSYGPTANSCRPGLVVGLRIACNGLCTAARFHNDEDDPWCRLGCTEGQYCLRHYNACPVRLNHLNSLWPAVAESMGRTAIFTDLLFKIAARGERLCILVAGLLDICDCLQSAKGRTMASLLNFRELIYGRVKMKTALCPAGAHTYQSMCLGYNSDQHRPGNFRLPKPKRKCSMLPSCRVSTRMTGIESTGWRLFPDGSFLDATLTALTSSGWSDCRSIT